MARELCRNRRTLLVFLLLCVTVYAQSAALLAAIEPHHATGHCCVLCHVGSLPFLEIASIGSVAPIVILEGFVANSDFASSHDVLLGTNSSRAPPA